MKYTKANIIGLPLVIISKTTGIMYKGAFKNTNGIFDVANIDNTYIMIEISNILFERIDRAYLNQKNIHEKSYNIHFDIEFGRLSNGNGQEPFLLFSSEEKANYVLKHFIIPVLIKERVHKADELMTQYLDFTKDVNRLENQLKDL